MVLRRGARRRHHHIHHRRVGLAYRVRGARGGGTARGLCADRPAVSRYWYACRIANAALRGAGSRQAAAPADQAWLDKAAKIPIGQLFLRICAAAPRQRRSSPAAARSSTARSAAGCRCIWRRNGISPPRLMARSISGGGWSAFSAVRGGTDRRPVRAQAGVLRHAGGRRGVPHAWVYAESDTALWIYGLLWSIGFLGFWAPAMILTAEITRRGSRRRQRLLLGGGVAGRICALAVRHHRHPAEHRLVRQCVPDSAGGDAADGRRHLAVPPEHKGKELNVIAI